MCMAHLPAIAEVYAHTLRRAPHVLSPLTATLTARSAHIRAIHIPAMTTAQTPVTWMNTTVVTRHPLLLLHPTPTVAMRSLPPTTAMS